MSLPATKRALDRFEDSVGGRGALIDTLEMSTLDKKQAHLLRLLYDPLRAHDSLVHIARDAGLPPTAVLEMFRSAAFAKAHALTAAQIADTLPAVMKDIADKAVDAKIECPSCFGEGVLPELGGPCPSCQGRGLVFRGSDLDRQKIMLEAGGVLRKGPGVAVQVNTNVNSAPTGAFFSKYVKASDAAAYDVSPTDVIEATPIEGDHVEGR